MAFCEIESEFDFGPVGNDDCFPMNLMSNENITWTVERERGISFDLTALTDPESRQPEGGPFQDVMRREVKLEAESGVKESTFGHPFGGQCRPQPRPAPPSPFSRGGSGPPNKRILPPSFELRDSSSAKRQQQWEPSPEDDAAPQHQQPRTLGRTRSRSVRPHPPKSAVAAAAAAAAAEEEAAAAAPAATPVGRSKSGHGRVKVEAAEARAAPRRRYVGGVDTMALTAELGLVDRRRCARRTKSGALYKVGAYTLEERAALVARFHAKRGRRIWRKKIKYDCRKKLADKRPRLKGRFVTQEELEGLDSETLAKVTGLGPWPEDASDVDAGEASDSSEGYTGPALTTSRYQGNKGGRRRQPASSSSSSSSRSPRKSLCEKAVAAAAKAAKRKLASTEEDGDDEEDDLDDGGSSTSAASEESDKMSVSPGGEEGRGGVEPAMERVSSSCKVSDLFAVKTEADVDMTEQADQDQQQTQTEEEEDEDDEDSEIKIEEYEPTDPVFGFMVDDFMSNNFNVVPTTDVEGMTAGVAVMGWHLLYTMHLMYYLENGKRVYTLKKANPKGNLTESAHPARFSPDDKFSGARVANKTRFGVLPTQQAPIVL
eukprot:g3860.t1